MKKQSQNNNNAGQSITEVRKSQKHEVNLQKNSTLYFQIGLILCLLGVFTLFEMQFKSQNLETASLTPDDVSIDYQMDQVKEYVPEKKEAPKTKAPVKIIDVIKVIDNEPKEVLKEIITSEQNNTPEPTILDPGEIVEPTKIDDDIHISRVQFAPIFPGCEKLELNSQRVKCLNEKLGKLVRNKFNSEIATDYGLTGVQRINVEFKVDKTGNITDIRTRSPHPQLDKEALRVANKIPKMTPGKMGETPVNVIYNLPITFKVQD